MWKRASETYRGWVSGGPTEADDQGGSHGLGGYGRRRLWTPPAALLGKIGVAGG